MAGHRELCGTDGVRDVATELPGPGLMNAETIEGLTYELIAQQLDAGHDGPVVVGRDTRPSSYALSRAAIAGAVRLGREVWDLGVSPTPAAQKIAQKSGALATVMITASHNPYTDNGWKGMLGSEKPSKAQGIAISEGYWRRVESGGYLPSAAVGTPIERADMLEQYTDTVVEDIQNIFGERPLDGKLIVVDGARGAGQTLTPAILERLGAQVERFACDQKGYINDGCGAVNLDGVKRFLAARPDLVADPGFMGALANDGDADRLMGVGVLNDNGSRHFVEINGNHIMHALAQGQPGIVGTEYTNTGLVNRLYDEGIGFEYCANGDMYVTEKLRKQQGDGQPWKRGGEFSGHLIDLDWLSSGDGVRMAAWLASYAAKEGINLAELYQGLPLWAEHSAKVPFAGRKRTTIKEDEDVLQALNLAAVELDDKGRVVLRPSGTEPVVRVWGEAKSRERIQRVVDRLAALVEAKAIQSKARVLV